MLIDILSVYKNSDINQKLPFLRLLRKVIQNTHIFMCENIFDNIKNNTR